MLPNGGYSGGGSPGTIYIPAMSTFGSPMGMQESTDAWDIMPTCHASDSDPRGCHGMAPSKVSVATDVGGD